MSFKYVFDAEFLIFPAPLEPMPPKSASAEDVKAMGAEKAESIEEEPTLINPSEVTVNKGLSVMDEKATLLREYLCYFSQCIPWSDI